MGSVLRQIVAVLFLTTLVACGGDGNYLAPDTNSTPNNTTTDDSTTVDNGTDNTDNTVDGSDKNDTVLVSDLEVLASSRQLDSSGNNAVLISAVVKDKKNNIVKEVDVSFAVNNGASIEPVESTAGTAVKTAQLTPGLNKPENRSLTVTIKAGTQERTIDIDVVGTTLHIDGPDRVVANKAATYIVKLQDSANKGLAYYDVNVQAENGSTITPVDAASYTTNAGGELALSVTPQFVDSEVITVTALGTSFSKTIQISNDEFVLSSPNEEIKVNSPENITLVWQAKGLPQANKTVALSATRGVLPSQIVTDAQGAATFSIHSQTAGNTYILATDKESGLSTHLVREFVAYEPNYLSLQSAKSVIAPKESVAITATIRDANDNPVKNQLVSFNANDAVNGSLSTSEAVTDSLGRASVIYTAGNAMSAKDGVSITAALRNNPEINVAKVNLTVGASALRLVLGEDEKLAEDSVFYKKNFGVIVTDSAGNAVSNAEVNFLVYPLMYYKGLMVCGGEDKTWGRDIKAICPAEDTNYNGNMDIGEDNNGNNKLDPTYPASVTRSAKTDDDGKAVVTITYPQSEALWSRVRLIATVVSRGTEYKESTEFTLPILGNDVSSCDQSPPNSVSPYGVLEDCATPK